MRVLSLFSASLASRVATCVVEKLPNVDEVVLLYFRSPLFEGDEHIRETVNREWPGVPFRTQSLKKEYRRMANVSGDNGFCLKTSCTECRNLMLTRGMRYMERVNADFLITGEIVGKNGLYEQDISSLGQTSEISDVVLRPLSAKLLPKTLPERRGWVDRDKLHGLTISDEHSLRKLATDLGLSTDSLLEKATRCKLTKKAYGKRIRDLLREPSFNINTLKLLDFRLYYKLPPDVKVVLAVKEEEKRALQDFFLPKDMRVYLPTHSGPMTLVRAGWNTKSRNEINEIIKMVARITATYSDAATLPSVAVNYRFECEDETSQLNVLPFSSKEAILEDTKAFSRSLSSARSVNIWPS